MIHIKSYKLFESTDNDVYVFHGTSKGAALRIKKDGLVPKGNTPIFLSNQEEYAQTYAKRKDYTGGVLLRTKKTNNIVPADNIVHTKKYIEYTTKQNIAPSEIEIRDGLNWVPLISYNLI